MALVLKTSERKLSQVRILYPPPKFHKVQDEKSGASGGERQSRVIEGNPVPSATRDMLITLANKFRKELKRVMEADPDFFFIQIGANDGKTADPLRSFILKYNWKGILVEPIKYYFEKLLENYSTQKGLIFENSSIGSKGGPCDMYRYPLRSNRISFGFGGGGLSSFSKRVPPGRSWRIPGAKNQLMKVKVNCITFPKLLDKYKVNKINLLVIDAEGYDFEILKQMDFHYIRPAIIFYEHNNLSPEEKKESIEFVTRRGYRVAKDFRDVLAY